MDHSQTYVMGHRVLACVVLSIAFVAQSVAGAPAQKPPETALQARDRGIELLEKGFVKEAIQALSDSLHLDNTDSLAWRQFGLALLRTSDYEKARKAFEASVKLHDNDYEARTALAYTLLQLNKVDDAKREALHALKSNQPNAEGHYVLGAVFLRQGDNTNALKEADAAIGIDPGYARALLLKYQSLMDRYTTLLNGSTTKYDAEANLSVLREAILSLRRYVELTPNSNSAKRWHDELQALQVYAADPSDRKWVLSRDADKKARILKKPEPSYTEPARIAATTGVVTLLAIFTAEGSVSDIVVIQGLPNGLSEVSIDAARKIKFVPAMKNGQPISVPMVIQYAFISP